MNRWAHLAAIILALLMKLNRKSSHPIKHMDSTDIPVCLFKNANTHKTMKGLASFGRSSKGIFYGLKMHMIADVFRKILSVKFSSGNIDDRKMVIPLSKDMAGLFIADAGYVSEKLSRQFYQEHKRILLAKPRANMKKWWLNLKIGFTELECWLSLISGVWRYSTGWSLLCLDRWMDTWLTIFTVYWLIKLFKSTGHALGKKIQNNLKN